MNTSQFKRILTSLDRLSDKTYQKNSWNGLGSSVSSWDELINNLYDDNDFDSFIEKNCHLFSDHLQTNIKELDLLVKSIDDKLYNTMTPNEILSRPEWHRIQSLAGEIETDLKSCALVAT